MTFLLGIISGLLGLAVALLTTELPVLRRIVLIAIGAAFYVLGGMSMLWFLASQGRLLP